MSDQEVVPEGIEYGPLSTLTATLLVPDSESDDVPEMATVVEASHLPLAGVVMLIDGGVESKKTLNG